MFKSIQRAGDLLSGPIANKLRAPADPADTATGGSKLVLNSKERAINLLWGAGIISDRYASTDTRRANADTERELHSHLSKTYGEAAAKLAFVEHGRTANGSNAQRTPLFGRQAERISKSAAKYHASFNTQEQADSQANWKIFSNQPGIRDALKNSLQTRLGYLPSEARVDATLSSYKESMEKAVRTTKVELKAQDFIAFMDPAVEVQAELEKSINQPAMELSKPLVKFADDTFFQVSKDMKSQTFIRSLIAHMYSTDSTMLKDLRRPVAPVQQGDAPRSFGLVAQDVLKHLDAMREDIGNNKVPDNFAARIFIVQADCVALDAAKPETKAGQNLISAMRAQADLLLHEVMSNPTLAASVN